MCGVFGAVSFRNENLAPLVPVVAIGMQNRGRDSSGAGAGDSLQSDDPNRFWKEGGSAAYWFENPKQAQAIMANLPGDVVAAHVRYATASKRNQREAQPGYADWLGNMLLVFSNGDIPFCEKERDKLIRHGCKFATEGDSEVIAKLIAMRIYRQKMIDTKSFEQVEERAFIRVGRSLQGTFSLVSITPSKRLFVMRDPLGNHPLWMTRTKSGLMVCSESAVLEEVCEETGRELGPIQPVEPGTLIVASTDGTVKTFEFGQGNERAACLMEYFYFSRPDSFAEHVPGKRFGQVRRMLGLQLAKEWKANNLPIPDMVTSVPYSGDPAGEGCAYGLGAPYYSLIMKNRFAVGRVFQGEAKNRIKDIRSKFRIDGDVKGKVILVVDDSIVRGEQSREIIRKLLEAGAIAVFYASTAPPFISPCYFGINVPDPANLVASNRTVEEVRQEIGADVLYYLSLEGTMRVLGCNKSEFCTGCFTREYPMLVPDSKPEV